MTFAVSFQKVSRHFGAVRAVDGVDLDIRPGEFFAMLGPSGSGKTTCLRLIAGFERPTAGHIEIFGARAEAIPPYRRNVNTVFQDYALFPHLNVVDNVAYGLMIKGVPKAARRREAGAALEMVKDDIADPTTDRIIEVLILAYQRGGVVVPEILEDLAEATTRDLWTMEQIRTEALEQKINSRVVFVLPWVVLVAMTARSGPFRDFYSTPAGLLVVGIGGAMSLLGVAIASRLGAQPPEPRVFGGAER